MASSDIALRNISHRAVSHESMPSDGISMVTSDGNMSSGDHSSGQPTPQNERWPTHDPDAHQSTELHQQLLGSGDDTDISETDNDTSGKAQGKMSPYLAVFAWWIPELIASIISVSTLGCIIGVLSHYNGSLLTEINLPEHLTLNGVIAALATVNRACLNTPVCSALLQQMWLYLANESEAKDSPASRLRDLELYTNASTGAWGSLVFLCKARVARIAACFGCIITILSLAFSTFTQQLISIELNRVDNTTSPGSLPRSETYSQIALPVMRLTQLYDFVGKIVQSAAEGVGFYVNSTLEGKRFNRERDNRVYFAHFELFGLPFGFALEEDPDFSNVPIHKPESLDLKSTECALWFCVQAHNTSISSNVQQDVIVQTFDSVNATEWAYNLQRTKDFQMSAVSAEMDPHGLTNFTIAREAVYVLRDYLIDNLQGNVMLNPGMYRPSSELIYGAWNGSTNPSAWIEKVAISMTNTLRVANPSFRDQYNGHRHELAIKVRWSRLPLPLGLVIASLVYLFFVMFQTAGSSVRSWKGSPLTLLLFRFDSSITEAAHGQVDHHDGLLRSIGDTKVRMDKRAGDIRELRAC